MEKLYPPGARPVSQAERDGLIKRHEWYGELAVSHAAPPTDPLRISVDHLAIRTLIAVLVACATLSVFFIAGLTLFIILLVQFGSGKLRPRYRAADVQSSDVLLEGFTVWMVAIVAMEISFQLLPEHPGLGWNALLAVPFALSILWLRLRGLGWSQMANELGWQRGGVYSARWARASWSTSPVCPCWWPRRFSARL